MFLTSERAHELVAKHDTPLFVYDATGIGQRAHTLTTLSLPYGLTVRYAVKANPHPAIIALLSDKGLHFDASSSYEAAELLEQGIPGQKISLSSQQPAHNLSDLLKAGVQFVATSLRQLELFTAAAPKGSAVGLRVNPNVGSGYNNRLTTGGIAASFGLWHEYIPEALASAERHGVIVDRLHIHIGTDGDPSVWGTAMDSALDIARQMPDVTSLDIGGGYKIAYTDRDKEADMKQILGVFGERLESFAAATGRRLKLEIEPGRWLVAHGGCLLTEIVDIVDTGKDGFTFLRTNTGMNDFLRAALYGAQHGIEVLSNETDIAKYVVVGHNCETSDLLTPAPHDPETILPRQLHIAKIGDLLAITDTGAYCASMGARGYNSFPQAQEIVL